MVSDHCPSCVAELDVIELGQSRDDDGRVWCPACDDEITPFVDAQLAYYEQLGRVVYRVQQAEKRRQLLQVVLVVAGALLAGLFLSPETRDAVSPVVGAVVLGVLAVGLWRVLSGRD